MGLVWGGLITSPETGSPAQNQLIMIGSGATAGEQGFPGGSLPFGFDPEGRAPASWTSDRIASVLGKNDKDLIKCKKGLHAEVHVTMYVEPHKKEGKVQAVGASVPAKDADEKIDCILNEVRGWKLPSPGSWAVKVEFRI